jgi:hypothetical protein
MKTTAVIFSLFLTTSALAAAAVSNPSIGLNTKNLTFDGITTSKTFKVWNKGTGKLIYRVAITDGNNYFSVSPTSGDSNDESQTRTHTVNVNYNAIPHNSTVAGRIRIYDTNSSQYIALLATETVASHVRSVSIEHGIDCNQLDCNEPNYIFRINILTDGAAKSVGFVTPDGDPCDPYTITDASYTKNEDIETWHSISSSVHSWTYQATFPEYNDLTTYWDGKYTIRITYSDSSRAETEVGFSNPQMAGAIPQPTQEPNMTNPPDDGNTVSPVQFAWDKCLDVNVGVIRVGYKRPSDINWIEHDYGKSITKTGPFDLDYGVWLSEMLFGRWYETTNDDRIAITLGKYIKNYGSFMVTDQFGTFDQFQNHALQLEDCSGNMVTFTLTGGGEGVVDNNCDFNNIILTGTTEKSVFTISTAGGAKTYVGNIHVAGPIKSIIARSVDLKGDITIDGSISMINFADVPRSSDISIGAPVLPMTGCTLKFGEINDLTLSSSTPVKSLTAVEWLRGTLDTSWISTLAITGNKAAAADGDFDANIILSGTDSPKNMTFKSAKIAGAVGGATTWNITGSCGTIQIAGQLGESQWNIDGNCVTIKAADVAENFNANITGGIGTLAALGNKKTGISAVLSGAWSVESLKTITAAEMSQFSVAAGQEPNPKIQAIGKMTATGWMSNCYIETTGNIGSITAGAMRNSVIGSIDEPNTLGLLQIKSIKGEAYCYINNNITASHIVKAYLAYPKTFNYDEPFSLTAQSIDLLTIKDPVSTQISKNLNDPNDSITIQDFAITLE